MKLLKPTILALTVTMIVSSTALAGNIGGLRTTGNIGGMRSAGNIAGTRTAGSNPQSIGPITNPGTSRLGLESAISGLIRMLLESGALL
jgi:hypothetical protein